MYYTGLQFNERRSIKSISIVRLTQLVNKNAPKILKKIPIYWNNLRVRW